MKRVRLFSGLVLGILFSACKAQDLSYDYYMQHPTQLQNAYTRCADQHDDQEQCNIIKTAAASFLKLVDERNRDPEAFGYQILQLQMKLAKATQVERDQQAKQLKTLYAVVAATSFE